MSTINETKLKRLLGQHKPGAVCLAPWLEKLGISRDLQKRYRRSGWLESIGRGAFKRPGDEIGWQGALYALQEQAALPIHAGAMTALAMQGLAHYLRPGAERLFFFSPPRTPLPAWFRKHDWKRPIEHVQTSVLSGDLGLIKHDERTFTVMISAPERAMLECLLLAPEKVDLLECFQVMEGLVNLRPKVVRELLAKCTSIKAKRLFLYMAEKVNHPWLRFIDASRVDLGAGDRSLARGGVYVSKYRLVLPESLAAL